MTETTHWLDLLERTYDLVRGPMAHVDDSVLDRQTPCAKWTVCDLIEHMIETLDMFASAAGAPVLGGEAHGAAVERFDAAAARNVAAWRSLGTTDSTLHLSFGDYPTDISVRMNQMEILVHGWDLGMTLGRPISPAEDIADAALQTSKVAVPPSRGEYFGAEVAAPGADSWGALIAFTGRDSAPWADAGADRASVGTVNQTV